MSEPYFESDRPASGTLQYPFSCHLENTRKRAFKVNAHWHYYIEILYSLSGTARVILGGACYSLNKGDMILINGREVHSISSDEGVDTKYIVIRFDPQVLYTTSRTVFESKYILPFVMAEFKHQKLFAEEEIFNTPVPVLINEIYQEFREKAYGFELAVRTDIGRLFLWILRTWYNKGLTLDIGNKLKESEIQKLQNVFNYLDENYKYDITAESAAKLCNMSYSYFCRQFKALIGKTFTEYLNHIRITEAEKLLLTTDMNITQIALETGFSNSSYFIQQFKHFKNISPKQFRKKILGIKTSK
ncbi:hypothetical protein CDQ84_09965 [Clostridium thermosuccinogenes]|uniref:HTH araC/xylS-type domain-containing protein n=1 Tax=Clostridium thermosuccinogenes TaxID=84032 RepID=A0A2K2F137_9CLOT|nr:AraC family transcriptional regulator [Pseudoclostridium thermosuccinogenes]AUS96851.1 hypothetical protein CDO33_10615 [Pseudoclostridium thermosuccinogenes]PNT92482.1 hypothetical protein CDQ83_02625 [Pseudoclostridium thermosuccinogenes]PNT96998.1 hypothetical protein CDQ85_09815 [Pseudoclostridium thermosuccinogenes]PNT98857.1 hypothetical protein CDQ84_09965 [Pseudoclostridium thermosuccinogenes]